jgi:Raf kinase inhibitor-like YbhB/YbcL family protein
MMGWRCWFQNLRENFVFLSGMRWLWAWAGVGLWAQGVLGIVVEGYERGQRMRVEHTCDGADLPPVVSWKAVAGAKAYVVWFYDPDAPVDTFTHWLVVNHRDTQLGPAQRQVGQPNDFGRVGYGGPCPPAKHGAHRYVFRVYALSQPIKVGPTAGWKEVQAQLSGKVLAVEEYELSYQRQRR